MITKHLTEEEIQQYALDRSDCETKVIEHIHSCEECKLKAAAYQLLFTGIKEQPQPSFDFDLSELVLEQLRPSESKMPDSFLVYLLSFVVILLAGTLLYIFRGYLLNLFVGITPLLIYLIVATAIIVLAALCVDMYKTYQRKMRQLDFY
jgi:hypothetical protein